MEETKKKIKRKVLDASFKAGACHISSALSCVDILVDLYYNRIKNGDIFIFSKASGVATYYSILSDFGYFSEGDISEYLKKYPLPSKEVPGVIHSMGSLGHGLPIAVGIALGDRTRDVYVLMSDGECQEGTTYESSLFARQHNITNLYVLVDNNKIQGIDYTDKILNLDTAFEFMKNTLPNVEIFNTVKGQGVDFIENDPAWHYKNLDIDLLNKALCQI